MCRPIVQLACLFVALPVVSFAQDTSKPKPPERADGWVMVEEDIWLVLADETDDHFIEAHEGFLAKDNKDAAEELREAAAFMKVEARRTKDKTHDELVASAKELDELADRVEKGELKSEKEMEKVFARADEVLARHFHFQADEYFKKNEPHRAGKALDAATDAIDNALNWGGQKAESGWDQTKESARTVAAKLVAGTGWVAEEVSEALEKTSRELNQLSKRIRTVKDDQ